MNCQNCKKTAMFLVGPDQKLPLCLDCYVKFSNVMDRQQENLERQLNYIADQFEMTSGIPGIVPRYPPRPPRQVLTGDVTLNHIRVSNSNIGVLNTGTIGTIDSAVGLLQREGDQEAAQALKALTEAVASDQSLDAAKKNEALELLSVIATEGAAPKEKRRGVAMRAVLRDLSAVLGGSAALVKLWEVVGPVIERLF